MNLHDKNPFLCSFDLLEARLGSPGLRVVDASWYLPAQKRDAFDERALEVPPSRNRIERPARPEAVARDPRLVIGRQHPPR